MSYISEYNRYKLEELKKLKGFFESCVKESDKAKVAGYFGAVSVFFGNTIHYNCFDIPYEAIRLIYEANKERIENELKFATVT